MNYKWTLKDAIFTKDKGKVFSCFACGGGSTMGYKLAGFDVIGCNEIDPKMAEVYKANHNPKYCYVEPIQTFKNRDDLPEELYNLDILDGSPPCSNFSMAGNREKDWGVEKKFREGQQKQVLDTLFFDFIDLAKKLQPKVVIAENVKGLLIGNAKKYVVKILDEFDKAGYYVTYKLLNAKDMGVPQRRERVFFIAIRKDLYTGNFVDLFQKVPYLELEFNQKEIPYKEIESPYRIEKGYHIVAGYLDYWRKIKPGQTISDIHPKGHGFQTFKLSPNNVLPTLRTSNDYYHYKDERRLFDEEITLASSFPIDYNFTTNKAIYICGMSVPPLMIYGVATEVYNQWLR